MSVVFKKVRHNPILRFFPLLLLLNACQLANELPENVLSQEKMVKVMVDMQLIEGALNQQQNAAADVFNLAQLYYDTLFAKYSINQTVIDSSLSYYGRRPEIFDKILEDVIISLSRLELNQKKKSEE